MSERPAQHLRPRLTLRQVMKLVIFGAVASMCLAPMMRLAENGAVSWPFALLLEAVAIPLVLAVAVFPLVRKGPLKDWLIRALLLTSTGIGLGAAVYSLAWAARGPRSLNVWANSGMPVGMAWAFVVVLGIPFAILFRKVVPGWCPACRAPTLVPDGPVRGRPESTPERASRCLACGERFQKLRGSWRAVPSDPETLLPR
jgi:hypothetical protein